MSSIPVVDFASCGLNIKEEVSQNELEKVGGLLFDALGGVGFAYLKNTGISRESVEEVNEVTRIFFEQPISEKRRFSKEKEIIGYAGVDSETLDPLRPPDYKEVFNISGCVLYRDDKSQWPDDLSPQFSNTMKGFMEQCKILSLKILNTLAVGMNLEDKNFFEKNHSLMHEKGNYTALRSLYYPPLPEELNARCMRLSEHSDYGSITLLFQDEVGGLQVQNTEGKFIDATPIEDTVLINVGDVLQFWSRGKLKSTKHRVEIPEEARNRKIIRRSLAYFVIPDNDVNIDEKLQYEKSKCSKLSDKNSDLLRPITVVEYIEEKLKSAYSVISKLT